MNTREGVDRMERLIQLVGQEMTSAVPRTEEMAAGPGKGTDGLRSKNGASIAAKPQILASQRHCAGTSMRLRMSSVIPKATPIPSSQARLGKR